MYRNYGSFGYITDNRNFGYKLANDDGNYIGDKIVSESGAIFLSVLDRKPQSIGELAKKLFEHFTDADIETILRDAIEFYSSLEKDGFITSGKTPQECIEKDSGFSYNSILSENWCHIHKSKKEIENTSQEYFDKYFEHRPQLLSLHIEISSKCNERCVHCYIPHEKKIAIMAPQMFYDILKQGMKLNLLNVIISGGEPMIHKNFMDFLRKCNEYNLSVNVLSNLTLLNQDIVKEMKCNPLLSVQTSLYSMDYRIHDAITGATGSFQKTRAAILNLVENDIPVQISCPIMKQNADCYKEVIAWGKSHNINVNSDYVIIGKYDHTTQNLVCRLSMDDIEQIIIKNIEDNPQYIESMEKEYDIKKNLHPNDYLCSVCYSSICISETGNVYPCAGWQNCVIANINDTRLSDIWTSKKVDYLRNIRRKDIPECIRCKEKDFCTPCMVRNANESPVGNPLEPNNFFCNIARLKKRLFLKMQI